MPDYSAHPPAARAALQEFDEWTEAALTARQRATEINAPLYHYTRVDSLKGIIDNQQIWFTHYRCLNDPVEVSFGVGIVSDLLKEVAGSEITPAHLLCSATDKLFQADHFHSNFDLYLTCFSRERDDLGQWRAYGGDGRGISLGLAPHLFAANATLDAEPHKNVFVAPVVYGKAELEGLVRPAIDFAVGLLERTYRDHRDEMADTSVARKFMIDLAASLISGALIPAYIAAKHPAYAHEREVRLMILGLKADLAPHVETRTRGSEIIPFIRHDMPILDRGVAEIVAGPGVTDGGTFGLRTYLRLKGLDGDALVQHSSIPYRPG